MSPCTSPIGSAASLPGTSSWATARTAFAQPGQLGIAVGGGVPDQALAQRPGFHRQVEDDEVRHRRAHRRHQPLRHGGDQRAAGQLRQRQHERRHPRPDRAPQAQPGQRRADRVGDVARHRHDHVGAGDPVLERDRVGAGRAGQGVGAIDHPDQAIAPDLDRAQRPRRRRIVAEHQVERAVGEARVAALVEAFDVQAQAGCLALHPPSQRLGHGQPAGVAHGDVQVAVEHARVGPRRAQDRYRAGQQRPHRSDQRLGARGQHERAAAAHEQRIVEQLAQLAQRMAERRLGQRQPLGRQRHRAQLGDDVEHDQQGQVLARQRARIDLVHGCLPPAVTSRGRGTCGA